VVVRADRHTAADDNHVAVKRGAERGAHRCGVIERVRDRQRRSAGALDERRDRQCARVIDLSQLQRPADRDELISGCHDRHAGPSSDLQPCRAELRENAKLDRPEPHPGRERQLPDA